MSTPFREPLRTTLLRTVGLALVLSAILSFVRGSWALWPTSMLAALWFTFGGHWVEVLFLNGVRPRVPASAQKVARVATWFVGGVALGVGARVTTSALGDTHLLSRTPWWVAGVGFVALEVFVHGLLQVSGRSSFFNGR